MARNSNALRSEEDYIARVFEECKVRVTKNLSQEFGSTENRILGALSRLLLNPLLLGQSGTAPETSRSALGTNQGTNENDSQCKAHPEASICQSQTTRISGPCDGYDMVTGVQGEVTYCSRGTSSGKQKKTRSASQPQLRSESTPATIERDQILLAIQQLINNSYSANFKKNIYRASKLPKSLTKTMPTFSEKTEKFELFKELLQTSLKLRNELIEDNRIEHFHYLMTKDALQTFKNINSPIRENLGEDLAVFRRKNVKPQPMATA